MEDYMNIIDRLKETKAEIKKGKIRKLFLEFLTDESVEFFNQNYGNQHAAYSVIYKKGWYVRPNRDLHHKKTMAYLKATEDGYVIPEKLSDTDYKTAASFYAHNLDDIKLYFDSTNNIIAFNEGKWEAKKGYEYEAESLGELVGIRKRRNYKYL